MSNYSKATNMKLSSALYGLLWSVVTIFMLSGCGGGEKNNVSGRITAGGTALSGVTVTLSGASMTTTTDANGNYSFKDVSSGTYTVTPLITGYTLNPPSRKVYLYGLNATDFNFSGIVIGRLVATNLTAFLKNDGTVWTWGSNSNGQLGNGTTTDSLVPVQVSGLSDVIALAAGGSHTVALKSDGTVWAWGSNSNGQLGNGTTTDSHSPVQASGLSNIISISAGAFHTIALRNDTTSVSVWTWGSNSNGQLGDGTTTQRTAPVQVKGLSSITMIAAGDTHTVALGDDGAVRAWGNNSNGQLGDGTITQRTTPVQASGLSSVTAIAAGSDYTVSLRIDGTVFAWGKNSNGQLGDGTTTDKLSPEQVQGL